MSSIEKDMAESTAIYSRKKIYDPIEVKKKKKANKKKIDG